MKIIKGKIFEVQQRCAKTTKIYYFSKISSYMVGVEWWLKKAERWLGPTTPPTSVGRPLRDTHAGVPHVHVLKPIATAILSFVSCHSYMYFILQFYSIVFSTYNCTLVVYMYMCTYIHAHAECVPLTCTRIG